jgi:hypothetical protein
MWQAVHSTICPDSAPTCSHGREASYVREMRKGKPNGIRQFGIQLTLFVAIQRFQFSGQASKNTLGKAPLQMPLCRLPKDLHSPHHPHATPESSHWHCGGGCCCYSCRACFATEHGQCQVQSLGCRRILRDGFPNTDAISKPADHVHVPSGWHASWSARNAQAGF